MFNYFLCFRLGKTIQTIALLAHLAHEKGIWGPHLIVVPTTLMLNWEMEFKKWCPAFKILTYYGSPRERKEKRKVIDRCMIRSVLIKSLFRVGLNRMSFMCASPPTS